MSTINRISGVLLLLLASCGLGYLPLAEATDCETLRQFTFSWPFSDACNMTARGGSTRGAPLSLDKNPQPGWRALEEDNLSDFERDRRAILAMAGAYRTSFDFLETVGYSPDYEPARPYQSWATETIFVIADRGDFISLQHIMVMVYQDETGALSAPLVMKHWRQDWQYEKRELLGYAGHGYFEKHPLPKQQVAQRWAQAVYQVDDSPRYESIGRWQHYPGFSTWLSEETWRPLPRRESTVRDDYDVLIGSNRHSILPTGWVQEEENYKVVLEEAGLDSAPVRYLAKELGLNRYQAIKDFDFSAGDQYWRATEQFWAEVRAQWQSIISGNRHFHLAEEVDGLPLFAALLSYADEVYQKGSYAPEEGSRFIRGLLEQHVSVD